tara:strand:- start:74 stop:568 length:495 start_codon:yes stop_codon:yes gene_type:complete
MGTRSSLAKLSREIYPGLDAIDENVVSLDDANIFTASNTFNQPPVCSYGNAIEVAASTLTIAYATHMGRPVIQTQACIFTLPAVADVQGDIWIINGAADGTLCTVSPDGSDKFVWDVAGAAGTDDKDLVNTAATAKKGDYVKLRYGAAAGWSIKEMGGIWADQA